MSDLVAVTENKEIVYASFILQKSGLEPIGTPSLEQWLECGEFLKRAKGAVHFWIGDWLNYGEKRWGEKYLEAIEATGYDYGTLRNDKWVAARVDLSRRHDKLSFDHHATVADLEPDEQDRLLTEAEKQNFDSKPFRNYVSQQQLGYNPGALVKNKKQTVESITHINDQLLELLENYNFDELTSEERDLLFSQFKKTKTAIEMVFGRYSSKNA